MKKIYLNESVCIGCHLCEVYCRAAHSRTRDIVKAYNRETPRAMPRVWVEVNKPVSFSLRCRQCEVPRCVHACLTGALHRDAVSGLVSVDEAKCIGCWTCVLACPYGAIQPDHERHVSSKCDLCKGQDIPACVANCPNEALVYAETQAALPL
jgi:anaerobic carbon-monoxide dehydrogenase iron sulfur subunit